MLPAVYCVQGGVLVKLTLELRPNPDCDSVNCAICGGTFRTAVRGVLTGSGSDHAICEHCIPLSQDEMLKKATEYLRFLEAWRYIQGQLCTWLEHAELERPTQAEIDVASFEVQLEQDEDEK